MDHDGRRKHHVFIGLYTCTCTVPLLTDSRPEMMFNRTSGHCILWREFSSIKFTCTCICIHHNFQKNLIRIDMSTSSFNWTRNSGRRCSMVLQGGGRITCAQYSSCWGQNVTVATNLRYIFMHDYYTMFMLIERKLKK